MQRSINSLIGDNIGAGVHSAPGVTGYQINGPDGKIGVITDFILSDQSWKLIYLVVEPHDPVVGKKLLIAVRHIKRVEQHTSTVFVDVSAASVKNCTDLNKIPEHVYLEIVHPAPQ